MLLFLLVGCSTPVSELRTDATQVDATISHAQTPAKTVLQVWGIGGSQVKHGRPSLGLHGLQVGFQGSLVS
jgi:hypothetical protein